jgi:hypothetical protein
MTAMRLPVWIRLSGREGELSAGLAGPGGDLPPAGVVTVCDPVHSRILCGMPARVLIECDTIESG